VASLALGPVSVGLLTLLNVSGLTALVGTRIYDDVPQAPTFPFVWYEVSEFQDVRGFGTGGLPEVELRVHSFSVYKGAKDVQAITQQVIALLKDKAVTVSGYAQAGLIFYDRTVLLPDELIQGVKCREMVAFFRIYVEEA
jgi:hypothetical protein